MDNTKLEFSDALRMARKDKKLTQDELAAKLGISVVSIRRYETGGSYPDVGILGSMCVALQNDSILDAWAYSKSKTAKKGTVQSQPGQLLYKVKDVAYRKYWEEIVQKGSWEFQKKLVYAAQSFQKMNKLGIRKALEVIDTYSKVPDYIADSEWAFLDKQTITDLSNSENDDEIE